MVFIMSAQTRSLQQHNIVDIIKEIAELAKTPSLVSDLYNNVIKQKSLTDIELKKLEDTRSFIDKYDILIEKFNSDTEFLDKEVKQHLDDVAAFNEDCK